MAAVVESRPTVIGHNEMNMNKTETSPSRFTAVNGGSGVSGEQNSGPSHSRSSEPPTTASGQDHTQTHERSQSVEHPPEKDKEVQPNGARDAPDQPAQNGSTITPSPQEENQNDSYANRNYNPNKRKRTPSPQARSTSPTRNATRSPPSNGQEAVEASGSSKPVTLLGSDELMKNSPAPLENPTASERPEMVRPNLNTSAREGSDDSQRHGGQLLQNGDASDARLAEALQQETQGSATATQPWEPANTPTNGAVEVESPSPSAQNSSEQPQRPATEGRPKKKRAFGHRTKTGCMTCRSRKKKCDELHPECNNCLRGGFTCAGYGVRPPYPRQPHPSGPVPLEPRDRYSEVPAPYVQDITSQRPSIGGPAAVHTNGTRSRILSVNDADRTMPGHITSPNGGGGGSRHTWPNPVWPSASSSSSFVPEHPPKTEPREPVMMNGATHRDNTRTDIPIMQHPPRDLSAHRSHGTPGMTVFPSSADQRPAPPTTLEPATTYSAQASQALNIIPSERGRKVGKNEKEKMRAGEKYSPNDPQLVEERRRCKTALARFENAQNPLHDVSDQEKTRLLGEILRPRSMFPVDGSFSQNGPAVRPGVVVETPFKCHYGYNIEIGPEVMISEGCTLIDDCGITIGAHTWIGPGVRIISSMADKAPLGRKGPDSPYQGRSVTIDCDCWIGPGCTILPGVTVHRGACISPGEVVTQDVGPYDAHGQPVSR